MKAYLIESDLMQARAIYREGKWLFLADDIMVMLGYPSSKKHHDHEPEEGWEECLLDTTLGKRYCYVLGHYAIMRLYQESPLDQSSKEEFLLWFATMQSLLENEPGIDARGDQRWELETVCASLHQQEEPHVMSYLTYWRDQNDSAEMDKQSEQGSDARRMVQRDSLKAERDLHQAAT